MKIRGVTEISLFAILAGITSCGPNHSSVDSPGIVHTPSLRAVQIQTLSDQMHAFSEKLQEYRTCISNRSNLCQKIETELNQSAFTTIGSAP